MASELIISYDGTPNDDDALELGRMLAAGGSSLALAYVRHSREFDPQREQFGCSTTPNNGSTTAPSHSRAPRSPST